MFLKPPFHKTVYVRGNLVCQLAFHCRELSLLHLSHHLWRMEHLCLLTEHTACFELAKGCPLSNPIEMLCCVTPKNSMDEEDVVADVLTKLFFCGSDVPNVKLLRLAWLQSRTMRSVSSPTSTVVLVHSSRLNSLLNNQEISFSWWLVHGKFGSPVLCSA